MSSDSGMVGYQLLDKFMAYGPEWALKGFLVVALAMYSFFALVLIKQVGIMTESFDSDVNAPVKMFAWLHFLLTIFLLLVAIVVL